MCVCVRMGGSRAPPVYEAWGMVGGAGADFIEVCRPSCAGLFFRARTHKIHQPELVLLHGQEQRFRHRE